MIRPRITRRGGDYFAAPGADPDIAFFSSGSKLLDLALGGGWAEGRVINIIGDKSTGKTLLAIEAARNFAFKHKHGCIHYREGEAAFLPNYAKALGMPIERVDFGRKPTETVEDVFEDLDQITKQKRRPRLYVIDSLDSLSDREELERPIDKGSYGAKKAKTVSEIFRRKMSQIGAAGITLMVISQLRQNIGASFMMKQYKRSGGMALDFYSSQTVMLAQIGQVKKGLNGVERVTGIKIKAKIEKNKIGLPFREADFALVFGYGLFDAVACCDYLKQHKAGVSGLGLPGEYGRYLRDLMYHDATTLRQCTEKIHRAVEKRWYQVERSFLPQQSKYVL